MPSLYSKVLEVMTQSPEAREDSQLENVQTWFRRNIAILANMEEERLHRLLKTVGLNSFRSETVIMKQGEMAGWMYVVLRGHLSVYQLSDVTIPEAEEEEGKPVQIVINQRKPVRIQLGQFITNLESGSSFGEMGLLRNGQQMTSVITDDACHLLVIDKATFDACLRETVTDLVAEKQRFVSHAYCFADCRPKVRNQLMLMMTKRTYQYNEAITSQGHPANQVFFILSGEVQILMDADRHLLQSPRINQTKRGKTGKKSIVQTTDPSTEDNSTAAAAGTGCDSAEHGDAFRKSVRSSSKSNFLQVSLMGVNESIGDLELMLKFDTYLQTTVCTRTTEVFVLNQSDFERVLSLKSGTRVLEELLLERSVLRLRCRLSTVSDLEQRLPFLGSLLKMADEYRSSLLQRPRSPRLDLEERMREMKVRRSRVGNRTLDDFYRDYIPSQGLLVDQFGRGTVFDRIQRQEKMRLRQKQKVHDPCASPPETRAALGRRRADRTGSPDTASDVSGGRPLRRK